MSTARMVTIDGNEAAAYIAHMTNEVIAIYPITPSSPMGEYSEAWSSQGLKNLWGTVPEVIEDSNSSPGDRHPIRPRSRRPSDLRTPPSPPP